MCWVIFMYMNFFEISLLALSLSADAFAVAVGTGVTRQRILLWQALAMAVCFWFFQAFMPIIGFSLASAFSTLIQSYDHWIAFLLLGYLGINMSYAGWKWDDDTEDKRDVFSFWTLITLAVATSIDALAVGVSLVATEKSIIFPACIIGLITFILSFVGVEFGKKFGSHIGSRAEIVGGLILIGIGTKILIEHLFFR